MPPHSSTVLPELAELHGPDAITVLHVDDDPDFVEMAAIHVEREASALDVVTETDAGAVLDRLETEPLDCVVSDYEMPGMDGLALLDAVREVYPELPFVLFTGKGSEEIASEAVSRGVTDYLQKGGGTEQYAVLANRVINGVRRYRAEREVRNGYQALEAAREGISLLEETGTFRYVNPAYADIYGYEPADLVGEHWEVLYPDAHAEQIYTEILPTVPEEGRWTGETVQQTAEGDRLVVDHALAYTDTGEMICLVRDVTEQHDRNRSLQWERRRFELVADAIDSHAVFTLDPEGYVTSWNQGAERITGYDEAEILGAHLSVLFPDDPEAYPDELLRAAIEAGTTTVDGSRVRQDGSVFLASETISAIDDADGQPCGFVVIARDVTDRFDRGDGSAVEQALDFLEDVFYVLDPAGNIVTVSDRAVEVTGYSRPELLSMAPEELFAPADRQQVRRDIERAVAEGEARIEATLVTADGRSIPYEFRKRRIVDEEAGVVGLAGIGRDVSERKRRERQLRRQLDQFEHFGSVLAHDIRTPLQTARGRLELYRQTGEQGHLDETEAALDRLDELVEDLSHVLREGELVSDVEPVDLATCVRSVWGGLETDDATLVVEADRRIEADETALKRLLENLLKNCVEHGSRAGAVTVTVGSLPSGFFVADDGPGISADERDRVFEAGYSTAEDGSGFGLASARQIAVAHGWEIRAGDASGARFEVTGVVLDPDSVEGIGSPSDS